MNHVKNIPKNFYNFQYTWVSSFLCGGGLAWSTQNGNYHHYPLCLFVPSAYAGYQVFNNREKILLKRKLNN